MRREISQPKLQSEVLSVVPSTRLEEPTVKADPASPTTSLRAWTLASAMEKITRATGGHQWKLWTQRTSISRPCAATGVMLDPNGAMDVPPGTHGVLEE